MWVVSFPFAKLYSFTLQWPSSTTNAAVGATPSCRIRVKAKVLRAEVCFRGETSWSSSNSNSLSSVRSAPLARCESALINLPTPPGLTEFVQAWQEAHVLPSNQHLERTNILSIPNISRPCGGATHFRVCLTRREYREQMVVSHPEGEGSGLWSCMFIQPRYVLCCLPCVSRRGMSLSLGPDA